MHLSWFRTVFFVTVLVALFAGLGAPESHAQGVSVAPIRVLFDAKVRAATVFLSNRTAETSTYRIALVNRRMLEDGSIVPAEVPEPGEYFADELIRFSPRRVTIAPYGSQTIRLMVRRPRGDFPEDVEFRTHMAIRSMPPAPLLQDLENLERLESEGKLSVQAVASVETVMPLIVRFGDPQATIEIRNPVLDLKKGQGGDPVLSFDLLRGGDRSVYGDLEIIHVAVSGAETLLHYSTGLAVYCPTSRRHISYALKNTTPQMLSSGQILIQYDEMEEMHGDQSAQLLVPLGQGQVPMQ
jgi:P pilus assembly chaperone PapD